MNKVEARTFTTADWPEWLDFELHERDEGHSEQSYLPYLRSRQALYQAMIADGLGDWWGSGKRDNWSPAAASSFAAHSGASNWYARTMRGATRGYAASC